VCGYTVIDRNNTTEKLAQHLAERDGITRFD